MTYVNRTLPKPTTTSKDITGHGTSALVSLNKSNFVVYFSFLTILV